MKSFFSTLILVLLFCTCKDQTPKVTQDFKTYAPQHGQIAVLPFKVSFNEDYMINSTRRNNLSNLNDYWREQSRLAGLDMQKEFFLDLVKQVQKGKMTMAVQDFLSTRKKLESAGIRFSEIAKYDKGKLARILGVDAVFWGQTEVNATVSNFGFLNPKDGVHTQLGLYNAENGALLWMDSSDSRPSMYSDTPSGLTSQTLHNLSKRQPYYKLNYQKR